jgi:hypothetical protein
MELEQVASRLEQCKKFVDDMFTDDFISATDYATVYEVIGRLDRKLEKRRMKQSLIQKKNEKKAE